QGGTARFYSRAYFWLKGTEDNGPLENVTISLPDPHVENKLLSGLGYIKDAARVLSAITDNGIVVEFYAGAAIQFVPPRTFEPTMEIGHGMAYPGPKFSFQEVDYLYPGEILEIQLWWEIPASMAGRLTLKDVLSPAGYPTNALVYSPKTISGDIFAGLYRLGDDNVAQKVEEFSARFENVSSNQLAWLGLIHM
ncbi:MAG: hypothetical protein AB1476_05245, partial [Candidatus Hadarchaeota archaeon]